MLDVESDPTLTTVKYGSAKDKFVINYIGEKTGSDASAVPASVAQGPVQSQDDGNVMPTKSADSNMAQASGSSAGGSSKGDDESGNQIPSQSPSAGSQSKRNKRNWLLALALALLLVAGYAAYQNYQSQQEPQITKKAHSV